MVLFKNLINEDVKLSILSKSIFNVNIPTHLSYQHFFSIQFEKELVIQLENIDQKSA
ncbi:MAG: hypothetical protein HeimC3_03530 [Candidatus Heimdallarchaeota archaeon LC_3]|nr:MAG: hypothetical protein HeimC3_03530 [Candidatus Heimdallarchaeota archaeon LC_3]